MKTKFIILLFLSISLFSTAQNRNKTINETIDMLNKMEGVSYFEVTKDMFRMLSESPNINAQLKDYMSKLQQLKMIQASGEHQQEISKALFLKFMENTNLKEYSLLVTKKESNSRLSFYKKEAKSENEFLLVSTEMIIYITGTIDLKSIGEFQQVMEIAGSAFDM